MQRNCKAVGRFSGVSQTLSISKPLPGLGATALQAGYHVGETIKRLVEGKTPESFKYIDKGTMAQIGRGAAVMELSTGQTMTGQWLG